VRQQRCERREKHDVERDDRAQQQNEATHLSTVASEFPPIFASRHTTATNQLPGLAS
jgi:hypothetical protein